MKPGSIRLLLVLALTLFALVVGIGSALVEIAIITRLEVEFAVERAELAANVVTSQLGISLSTAANRDLVETLRGDSRLSSVLKDMQEYTPPVMYIMLADTSDRVLLHSDPSLQGQEQPPRPGLVPRTGIDALGQFFSMLKETGTYEVSSPLLLDSRDFGTVRVGLAAALLRGELREILTSHIWRLIAQVILATILGASVSWIFILRPLNRIETGIHRLQEGDFNYRLPVDGRNELGQLATQINVLSETLAQERDRLLTQRETLESEGDALRRIVDTLDDGLLMLNRQSQVLMANRTACRILGLSFSELSGKPLKEALPNHPLVQLVHRSFHVNHRPESAQIEFDTGTGRHVFLTTCQLVGDSPKQEGGIVTLRDYSRMQEIQELLDHARVLSRLGKMAAGVAHEIRNPLNAMNIHLELMQEEISALAGSTGRERLEIVRREIARLEKVVYGFLKLARLQELSLTRIPLAPFLDELRTLVRPEARMAGLEIVVEVAQDVPDVYGDEEVLRQALLNLLRNAIQASPPGSRPVRVTAESECGMVRLVVEDHGQGMSHEVQSRVFDLYFTTKKDGSGVGLALVQQAVEMHGGSIDLRSEPEKGSIFTIRLPALVAA